MDPSHTQPNGSNQSDTCVAAAENNSYDLGTVRKAVRQAVDSLGPSPLDFIRRGDKVLIKVNMGCSGLRDPALRQTTHPTIARAMIETLIDCGARVYFGDDVARSGKHSNAIHVSTGMADVAAATGATLVDFVTCGAREVRSGLLYPSSYLVTNAYFDADLVINAANCRSGPSIVGMSGAIKNMFGCVVGRRKLHLHNLFGADQRSFGRAIADVHRQIPADLSFLDLTTVSEGFGVSPRVKPVGLLLASVDPVALDTVAVHAIGYESLPMWPTFYGNLMGLGCNDMSRIRIRGVDREALPKSRLAYPAPYADRSESFLDRMTRVLNHTVLRARPAIHPASCNGCGDCIQRCPVKAIVQAADTPPVIDHAKCADCECCVKVCETSAIHLEFIGLAANLRKLSGRKRDVWSAEEPVIVPDRIGSGNDQLAAGQGLSGNSVA